MQPLGLKEYSSFQPLILLGIYRSMFRHGTRPRSSHPMLYHGIRSLLRDVLSDESGEVVHLAQRNTLLSQDIVSSNKVEEQVGGGIARDVAGAGKLSILAGSQTKRNNLSNTLVDEILVGLGQELLDGVDALEEVGKGLHVVLELLRLGAGGARKSLLGNVGDEVDLEGQRKHVLVDAGFGESGGIGSRLSLFQDGL